MTILALLLAFCLCAMMPVSSQAQALGTWQVYPSYMTATRNIPVNKRIYALMENKLMVYDSEDKSITTFDCLRQLNDVNISFIDYSEEAHRIILVYDNSNIDLLSTEDDDDVINLAQLKNKTYNVAAVSVKGERAYLATNGGVVVVDMRNCVILSVYDLQKSILSAASDGTRLFAATESGIYKGNLTDNLQDPASWTCVSDIIRNARAMLSFKDRVFCVSGSQLCWSAADGGNFGMMAKYVPTVFSTSGDHLYLGNATTLDVFTAPGESKTYRGIFGWTDLREGSKNLYWASDGLEGLQAYKFYDSGIFELVTPNIRVNSPQHDYSHHVQYIDGRLLVTGGSINYGYVSHPGTAMLLEPDGTWRNMDYDGAVAIDPEDRYIDATDIAQDPLDPEHHYVCTARDGIYEFRSTKCVGHITLGNSPLLTILPNDPNPKWFVVASGSRYDPDGNLWVLNSSQDTIIRILKPDGKWNSLYYSEIAGTTAIDHLLFDSRGWAWMTSRRMAGRGLFCLQYNGTITTTSDDRHILRSTITNQDNTTYAPNEFYGIAEDHDGNIWFGTEMGPFVVSNPEGYMDADFTFEQVKVSRNDGSGLADYLLSNIPVTCIAVDGGNRKWFGTQGNGVYLISADSQEQIYHFTTDNSPLLANDINGIAIDGQTGVVVFATEKGLCSFVADATEPVESPTDDSVIVYPNPVSPDYNGPIAIRGLAENSDVKIVSTTGQIVWNGTSTGGLFTWNGCTRTGRRVASGIYIVLSTEPSGKKAVAAKIAFIK